MDDLTQRLRALSRMEHSDHTIGDEAADEIERLRAELELRRKSGSASDRLHNICQAIADVADGSEFSREEWDRLDAENKAMREEFASLVSMFHHAVKDAGWHPGRTDDNLCDIIRAKGKELAEARAEVEGLRADAMRYRYLRDIKRQECLLLEGPEAGVWCDCENEHGELILLTEGDLDAAIDAAIAARKP